MPRRHRAHRILGNSIALGTLPGWHIVCGGYSAAGTSSHKDRVLPSPACLQPARPLPACLSTSAPSQWFGAHSFCSARHFGDPHVSSGRMAQRLGREIGTCTVTSGGSISQPSGGFVGAATTFRVSCPASSLIVASLRLSSFATSVRGPRTRMNAGLAAHLPFHFDPVGSVPSMRAATGTSRQVGHEELPVDNLGGTGTAVGA